VPIVVSDDDPVTGRRMLTGSAYADDQHLRSRMSMQVEQAVQATGSFRATTHRGVFICRFI
jgi:hypothetical protein